MAQIEVWSDIHQDFKKDAQGGLKKVINVDSVMTSIDNILRTKQGERVMLPSFATTLADLTFDPMSDNLMGNMAKEIKRSIEKWDDRVSVTGVQYFQDPDNNTVIIYLSFTIKGYSQTFNYKTSV